MKTLILIFVTIFYTTATILGQDKRDCFEIRYLDFFGIENLDTIKWPVSVLDQLLTTDFLQDENDKAKRTNFLIPLIVLQLKGYHPSCATRSDSITFRKLKELYYKIRQQDVSAFDYAPIASQLEKIRQDFYLQVQDDTLLPYMNFTLDDGPYYGQLSEIIPEYKKGETYKTEFGTLCITRETGKVFLTVLAPHGEHLWTRIITGSGNRFLNDIAFSENNVLKTSLGYKLRMFSKGEALTLYLKSNGAFRYYFHSW
jgi:hypothetical protein